MCHDDGFRTGDDCAAKYLSCSGSATGYPAATDNLTSNQGVL
jgi:hypothetical protein